MDQQALWEYVAFCAAMAGLILGLLGVLDYVCRVEEDIYHRS